MNFRKMNLMAIILAVCLCTAALANTSTIGQAANFEQQAITTTANLDMGNGCAAISANNLTNTGFILDNIPAAVNFNEANLAIINTATAVNTAPQANLARHRWWDQASNYLTQHAIQAYAGYNGTWGHSNSLCRAEAATAIWMNHMTLAGLGSPPTSGQTATMAANQLNSSNFA